MPRLRCKRFSVFPHMFWPLISHFSLLFPFFCISSLFSFHSRVCFSFKLPFTILRSLVNSSCSCFFSSSSIVNYSSVRSNFPSIAFLFTRLGCLLEFVEEGCLDWISLFMREDYTYEPVLSLLFPLISHSAKVARSSKCLRLGLVTWRRGYPYLMIA